MTAADGSPDRKQCLVCGHIDEPCQGEGDRKQLAETAQGAIGSLGWLVNNAHNHGTVRWRELEKAAREDADNGRAALAVLAEPCQCDPEVTGLWSGADPRIVTLRRERDAAEAKVAALRRTIRQLEDDQLAKAADNRNLIERLAEAERDAERGSTYREMLRASERQLEQARPQAGLWSEIASERIRQDKKWGGVPGIDRRDDHTYPAVLTEEVGEACKAWLERDVAGLRTELVQVAAIAVSWIEELDNGGMRPRALAAAEHPEQT